MRRFWARLSPFFGLLLFAVALWVLNREVRHLSLHGLSEAIRNLPRSGVALAFVYTTLNYVILTGYDQLAFVYIGRTISRWQVAMASFVGYAIANNVGFALLSGTSARYRFYSRWGLNGGDISRVVVFYSGTFWLGLIVLGSWSLLFSPMVRISGLAPVWLMRSVGGLLLAIGLGYAAAPLFWKRPLTVAGTEIALPSPPLIASQFVLSVLDWSLAAAVLYVLLPISRPDFTFFLGAFLAAQLIALVSHVPGGIGVFESLMILLLKPWVTADEFLPALAVYRLVYYLFPLLVALAVLLVDEFNSGATTSSSGATRSARLQRPSPPSCWLSSRCSLARYSCSRAPRPPSPGGWPGSPASCRSQSSRARTSSAASSASAC
jgi:phosphatidylglycerol lysyltransferase